MFISFRNVAALFEISKETVQDLKVEVEALRRENTSLSADLLSSKTHLDWLKIQFNQLQTERALLLDKLYGIAPPVPQLMQAPPPPTAFEEFSFNDMGDALAREIGLPIYGE